MMAEGWGGGGWGVGVMRGWLVWVRGREGGGGEGCWCYENIIS